MKNMGFKVQGSDQGKNKNTLNCSRAGIKVFIGHSKKKKFYNISKIIGYKKQLRSNTLKKKIPIYSRAEAGCGFSKKHYHYGSHSETTTTSLVSKILTDQKLDPTIINGGVINSFNAKLGRVGNIRSRRVWWKFLKLPINYSVATNIDYEHVEFYKNFKNLENSFINL